MSIIKELINSKGANKSNWKLFLSEIIIENSSINKEIFIEIDDSLDKNINLDLILDIMDLIFDYGNENIINLLIIQCIEKLYHLNSNKGFKTNEDTAKKNLYLIQKLNKKYGNKNDKIKIIYEKIQSLGIEFPNDTNNINTYLKFISKEEIQEGINISNHQKNIFNKNIMKTIYLDTNPFLGPNVENKNPKNIKDNNGIPEISEKSDDKSNINNSNIDIKNQSINNNNNIINVNNNNKIENNNKINDNNNINSNNSIKEINNNNVIENKSSNQMNDNSILNNNNKNILDKYY